MEEKKSEARMVCFSFMIFIGNIIKINYFFTDRTPIHL